MRRWVLVVLVVLVAAAVVGCTGRGERGRNQDMDRPKATGK